MGFADADRGAEVRRLDKERVFEGGFDPGPDFAGTFLPVAAEEGDVFDDGEPGGSEEAFHDVLVHAGCGAEDAGADVGDSGKFEEALDGAVFAEGAVKDRKDDIEVEDLVGADGGKGVGVLLEGNQ